MPHSSASLLSSAPPSVSGRWGLRPGERCVGLMNTDLLSAADQWKATLKDLRERVAQFERAASKAAMEPWKAHLDRRPRGA